MASAAVTGYRPTMSDGPHRGVRGRVLTWAVATSFFAMPLPLTLLAWDLYGGFAIHGKILLTLFVAGGAARGAIEVGAPALGRLRGLLLRAAPSAPTTGGGDVTLVALLLLLSQALALSSVAVAPGVARLLQLWTPQEDGTAADAPVTRAVYAILVLVVGLRARGPDDAARFGGALAMGWFSMIATEFGGLVWGWPAWLGALALVCVLGAHLLRPMGPPAAARWARSAPAFCVAVFAWLLLSRAPEVLFGIDPRPLIVRGAVALIAAAVGLGVFALLPRAPWLLGATQGAAARAVGGTSTVIRAGVTSVAESSAVGLIAGVALALLSLPLATLGGLCGELAIPVLHLGPEPSGPITVAGPSRLGDLGLALGLVRLGMITRDAADVRRMLSWVGAGFTLAALAGIGSIQLPPLWVLADLGLLTIGVLPWLPSRWLRPSTGRGLGVLLALAPIPGLAVAARYLAAAFPLWADPMTLATGGAILGLPLGILLARLRVPQGLTAGRLLLGAVLALLALGLLIYVSVFFAVAPAAFFGTAGTLTLCVLGTRRGPWAQRGWPALPPAVAVWLLFYAAFAAVVVFKEGPSAESCAAIVRDTEARVLLDRFGEGGAYPSGDPYDVLPDPTGRWLVTTFKRFDDRGGWIEVLDVADPSRRTRTSTKPVEEGAPFWPERFVVHPLTGRYYFGMLGIGAYELWEMELRGADGDVPRIERVRSTPMDWEPSYPDIDVRRDALVQSYLTAGVEKPSLVDVEQPLVHRIDLQDLRPRDAWSMGRDVEEMSEFVTVHPVTGDYYVPGYFNLVRFALVEVDGDTLQLTRRKETFHPTIAVGFDAPGERMFVTNSLGGTLDVYDLARFERTATVRSGAFPRDLVVDGEGERVFVGNYSSGTVVEFDVSGAVPRPVRTLTVGPLLRGIGMHEPSGAVYAASACGVFEITPGRP